MAAEPKVGVMLRLPVPVSERARAEAKRFGLTFTAYVIEALVRRADEDEDFDTKTASDKGSYSSRRSS